MSFRQFRRHPHSKTIFFGGIGAAITAASLLLPEGRWFDLCLGVGLGFATVGAIGWGDGFFREVNRPEE